MKVKLRGCLVFILLINLCACDLNPNKKPTPIIYKGVYSFGPEVKSFKDCDNGSEFWVTDESHQLELQYSQLKFEKPYEPVYIEVEGSKVRSGEDGLGAEYDSTLVVKKLVKITKVIPQDLCGE